MKFHKEIKYGPGLLQVAHFLYPTARAAMVYMLSHYGLGRDRDRDRDRNRDRNCNRGRNRDRNRDLDVLFLFLAGGPSLFCWR